MRGLSGLERKPGIARTSGILSAVTMPRCAVRPGFGRDGVGSLALRARLAVLGTLGLRFRWRLRRGGVPLGRDQTVEPGDLALVRVEPVVHQLDGVGVHAVAYRAQRRAQVGEPLLEVATATFELVQAAFWAQVAEERQSQGKAVLLEVVGVGRLEHFLEEPLAAPRQPVHVLLARGELRRLLHLERDRKSTRLNSSHMSISYAVFCLKKK